MLSHLHVRSCSYRNDLWFLERSVPVLVIIVISQKCALQMKKKNAILSTDFRVELQTQQILNFEHFEW